MSGSEFRRFPSAKEKIINITSYLDSIEQELPTLDQYDHTKELKRQQQYINQQPDENSSLIYKLKEAKVKLAAFELEAKESNKTIETLKSMVEREKEKNKKQFEGLRSEYEEKMKKQKSELELIISRHLTFIDELINDKKQLSEDCERLMKSLQEKENIEAKITRDLKEKHSREMKANKDAWVAAEKARKDKWVVEKTQEIKEITIKGLEPELERMMKKHKDELKKLEEQSKVS